MLDVCSPLCGPDHSLHHLNNPMHTLFPPYPNRFALDIYQSLTTPFIRSTTTPPQLPHINSWASKLCPPPSTGALTRLWRDNVSDVGESLHLTPPPWTSARLPGAGSHNKEKVLPPRTTHQANPCPLPLFLLPTSHATCIRSLLVVVVEPRMQSPVHFSAFVTQNFSF